MLACAEAWTVLDRPSRTGLAHTLNLWLQTSRSLIEQFGYHEYRFLEETISKRVAELAFTDEGGSATEQTEQVELTNRSRKTHEVLTRLRTFRLTDRSVSTNQ